MKTLLTVISAIALLGSVSAASATTGSGVAANIQFEQQVDGR